VIERATLIRDRAIAWLEHHGTRTPSDYQISLDSTEGVVGDFKLRSWKIYNGSSESLEVFRGDVLVASLMWNAGPPTDDDEMDVVVFDDGNWEADFVRQVSAARPEAMELVDFAWTFEQKIRALNIGNDVCEMLRELRPAVERGRADVVAHIVSDVSVEMANEKRRAERVRRRAAK
jgi:hypothetical protein